MHHPWARGTSAMYLEIPILGLGTLPFLLVCLPSQIKARNVAIVTLLVCLFLTNLIRGVNAVSGSKKSLALTESNL